MKSAVDQLANYAAYHRDRRNIRTHFAGIPMIVLAVAILLAHPLATIGNLPVSATLLVVIASCGYYLWLDLRLGLVMTLLMAGAACTGAQLANQDNLIWLGSGVVLFVVGWVLQFIGHYYEGKKPAFVDDIVGLLIGPLFVLCEFAFLLGLRKELQHAIETRVGGTH